MQKLHTVAKISQSRKKFFFFLGGAHPLPGGPTHRGTRPNDILDRKTKRQYPLTDKRDPKSVYS